jgi:hypothetical protein
MPFKPNYNHQRAERNRAKEQKKLEKRQRRDEEAARRKGTLDQPQDADAGGEDSAGMSPDTTPENADGSQETAT